jgi:hypothetical protein
MMTQELLTEIESNLKHADFRRELENLLQTTIERYSGPAFGPLTKSLMQGDPMTESAREEALRLAREAGFIDIAGLTKKECSELFERLIALARQRPEERIDIWQHKADFRAKLKLTVVVDGEGAYEFEKGYFRLLAAAPKPEDI